MPVSCELRSGKWVATDKEGKTHGTHDSEGECNAQARAINADVEMGEVNIITAPDDCDFVLADKETLVFEKEHAYADKFFDKKNDYSFELTPATLIHFAQETNRYIEAGNQSNLPTSHTSDVEANRGVNETYYTKTDSKGRFGLFSRVRFRDAEAAKLAKTAQTSIFAPPKHTDGKGTTFVRPIRHVALTDYPVVPGLDGFTPIAASLVSTPSREENAMSFKDLAADIGLQLAEDVDTDDIQKAISKQFKDQTLTLSTAADDLKKVKLELSDSQTAFDTFKKENPAKQDPVRTSPVQVEMLAENRELKLSQLVGKGITPKVKDLLQEHFCGGKNLELCLSEGIDDGFNKIIDILRHNEGINLSSNTGDQSGAGIATLLDAKHNPMMAAAEKRAERFAIAK